MSFVHAPSMLLGHMCSSANFCCSSLANHLISVTSLSVHFTHCSLLKFRDG